MWVNFLESIEIGRIVQESMECSPRNGDECEFELAILDENTAWHEALQIPDVRMAKKGHSKLTLPLDVHF